MAQVFSQANDNLVEFEPDLIEQLLGVNFAINCALVLELHLVVLLRHLDFFVDYLVAAVGVNAPSKIGTVR